MKKKLLALFVVCALALTMLAACGQSGGGDTPAPAGSGAAAPEGSAAVAPEGGSAEYTFYLTRHGQTVFNVRGIAQGWCDSPLTEDGVAMAKQLNKSMADIPFDKAYSSDLTRAFETAEYIVGDRDIPIIWDKNLRETNLGTLEGSDGSDDTSGKSSTDRIMGDEGWHDVGGENMAETGDRVAVAIERIIAENPNGGTFLVTSHGGAITAYLDKLFGGKGPANEDPRWMEFLMTWKGAMPNCAVSVVKYKDGVYDVQSISDVSYLGELAPSPDD